MRKSTLLTLLNGLIVAISTPLVSSVSVTALVLLFTKKIILRKQDQKASGDNWSQKNYTLFCLQ